jgi:hypothetical protein
MLAVLGRPFHESDRRHELRFRREVDAVGPGTTSAHPLTQRLDNGHRNLGRRLGNPWANQSKKAAVDFPLRSNDASRGDAKVTSSWRSRLERDEWRAKASCSGGRLPYTRMEKMSENGPSYKIAVDSVGSRTNPVKGVRVQTLRGFCRCVLPCGFAPLRSGTRRPEA